MWSLAPGCEVWGDFLDFWPYKMHYLENSLLSWHFTCIIHNCQIFQNSKTTVQTQLRIPCTHCRSFCWISLWVYLWLSADVFRLYSVEKGLFGCKKPDNCQGLHTEVRTSPSHSMCIPPTKYTLIPLLLWIKFLKFIPLTWLMIRIQHFTAMLNTFFNVQSSILIK